MSSSDKYDECNGIQKLSISSSSAPIACIRKTVFCPTQVDPKDSLIDVFLLASKEGFILVHSPIVCKADLNRLQLSGQVMTPPCRWCKRDERLFLEYIF